MATVILANGAHAAGRFGKPDAITAERLKAHLEFIASDELEGRGTPSRGLDTAAKYIAAQCKLWGLKPGANGSFFQRFAVDTRRFKGDTQNVIAILEGTDPKLKAEYIGISAHYDHLGMKQEGLDKVFNGADDDGSGTVSVLEIAHAFAMGPRPKRSMIFTWHAGEERGLLGSKYFTANPTIDLKNYVALFNIDMIGRTRFPDDNDPRDEKLTPPGEIYVIGTREMSDEFGDWVTKANLATQKLKLNYYYDQPSKPENLYRRSDHYMYALKGIPIAFFFDGVHQDYHQVSDEVGKIDFTKMESVSRMVYSMAFDAANNHPKRPKIVRDSTK